MQNSRDLMTVGGCVMWKLEELMVGIEYLRFPL